VGRTDDGDAAAAAELYQPFVSQRPQCPQHGVAVDAKHGGEVPGGRQALARAEFQTATGTPTGVTASFTTSIPSNSNGAVPPVSVGCASMALDPSGRFPLVPYWTTAADPGLYGANGSVSVAVISTATGVKSTWTIPGGGLDVPGMMTAATVAW
jgi:hypothetical protein